MYGVRKVEKEKKKKKRRLTLKTLTTSGSPKKLLRRVKEFARATTMEEC